LDASVTHPLTNMSWGGNRRREYKIATKQKNQGDR
jgi:hypothetical protein